MLYPDFCFFKRMSNEGELLEVTQSFALQIPQANNVFIARVLFCPSSMESILTYDIQILFTSIQSGEMNDSQQIVEICSMITRNSGFKFCPGLDEKRYYGDYHKIGYHIRSVRLWDKPFKRIDSCNCLLWYKFAKNASLEDKAALVVLCKACKRLYSDLDWQISRSADVSPSKKAKRQFYHL